MKINIGKLLIIFLIGCLFSCISIPNAGDADEANEVSAFIKSHFDIKPEKRNGFSGYHKPGVHSTGIKIYGMVSKKEQDRLINLLEVEKAARNWKIIELSFYEKEILLEQGNVIRRGKEKLLREITIR